MSIRERKLTDRSSVYDVVIELGTDPVTGKRRQSRRTCKTRKEAKAFEREELRKRDAGELVITTKETLAQYLTRWLADVVDTSLEPTTRYQYHWAVHKRIVPTLGDTHLADLTPGHVQAWVSELSRQPSRRGGTLGRRSVEEPYTVLRRALNLAVTQRLMARNPAIGVVLPKRTRHEPLPAWSPTDAATFLQVAQQSSFEPFWTLAVFTGMRRGELLALRWADVDLEAGHITVRRSRPLAGSVPVEKQTKSGRSRRVPLPASVVAYLRDWQEQQATHILECCERYNDQDLVCCSPSGIPWYPSTLTHNFQSLVTAAGVTAINLHGTRRTYASVALRAGESLAAVAEVLGHADRLTTISIYQDVHADQHVAVASAVEDAVMTHFAADVSSNVSSPAEDVKNGPEIEAVSLESVVRPWRLERQTFRSATRGRVSAALLKRRIQRTDGDSGNSAAPEETEGQRLA